jgi:predicted DCC family thiol-disulfide oxidoreductase YuxK
MANPVLIFDGDCGFCTTTANYIVKRSKTPITAHAWQLIDVTKYGILQPQAQKRVYIIDNGHAYGGHEAFAHILRLQKNVLLSAIAFVMVVPPVCWLSRIGYALVSRCRHKLPGGTPACKLPSGDSTSRESR